MVILTKIKNNVSNNPLILAARGDDVIQRSVSRSPVQFRREKKPSDHTPPERDSSPYAKKDYDSYRNVSGDVNAHFG